jgi:hypothetical protein
MFSPEADATKEGQRDGSRAYLARRVPICGTWIGQKN